MSPRKIINDFKYSTSVFGQANKDMDDGILALGVAMAAAGKTEQEIRDEVWRLYDEDADWMIALLISHDHLPEDRRSK